MGRDTIRTYLRTLGEAGLLEGRPDELPELEALRQTLAQRLPPRPTPQQTSTLAGCHANAIAVPVNSAGPGGGHASVPMRTTSAASSRAPSSSLGMNCDEPYCL